MQKEARLEVLGPLAAGKDAVVLITIYSKTEQEDVSPSEIRRIIEQYDAETSEQSEESAPEKGKEMEMPSAKLREKTEQPTCSPRKSGSPCTTSTGPPTARSRTR